MKKKLKWILILGSLGIITFVGFVIWAFVSIISFGSEKIQSASLNQNITQIENHISNFTGLQAVNCWNHFQKLAQVEVWLQKPLGENLDQLTSACFKKVKNDCKGADCQNEQHQWDSSQEGEII